MGLQHYRVEISITIDGNKEIEKNGKTITWHKISKLDNNQRAKESAGLAQNIQLIRTATYNSSHKQCLESISLGIGVGMGIPYHCGERYC